MLYLPEPKYTNKSLFDIVHLCFVVLKAPFWLALRTTQPSSLKIPQEQKQNRTAVDFLERWLMIAQIDLTQELWNREVSLPAYPNWDDTTQIVKKTIAQWVTCIVGECYSAQTFAVYLTHHRGPVLPIDSPRQACLLVPLDLPSNWHNFWPITCQPGHLPQQTVLGVLYVLTCTFYLPPEALSITTLHEVLCLGPLATFPNWHDWYVLTCLALLATLEFMCIVLWLFQDCLMLLPIR